MKTVIVNFLHLYEMIRCYEQMENFKYNFKLLIEKRKINWEKRINVYPFIGFRVVPSIKAYFFISVFKNLHSNNNILWTLNEVEMDPEKPKRFNPQLKVWDFAKILASEFQNLPFGDKSNILKKYHIDTYHQNILLVKAKLFFACFLANFG